jgi:hypothetical protein
LPLPPGPEDELDAPRDVTEDRIARTSVLARLLPTPQARRIAIFGGAGVGVLLLLVIVLAGGKHGAPAAPTASKPVDHAKPPVVAAAVPQPPAPAPPVPAPTAPPATHVTAPPPPTPASQPPPVKRAPRKLARSNKPIVVDYDKTKAPPSPADHDVALERARSAYATGNQHLFAGETGAAIAAYKQALAVYPNYVAGYRGLGLAYAQQGDRAAAVKAFKTYVGLAPSAKDVELIKKRIARLSAK